MFQSAFSRDKNEENSDTDMYMPPLVHVRTLFFLFLLRLVSSLSSFVIFPLSFSVCLPCDVALVLCLVCVCVCVSECAGRGRDRVHVQNALRVSTPNVPVYAGNMCAYCRYTRGHHTRHNHDHAHNHTQHRPHKTRHTEAKRKEEKE